MWCRRYAIRAQSLSWICRYRPRVAHTNALTVRSFSSQIEENEYQEEQIPEMKINSISAVEQIVTPHAQVFTVDNVFNAVMRSFEEDCDEQDNIEERKELTKKLAELLPYDHWELIIRHLKRFYGYTKLTTSARAGKHVKQDNRMNKIKLIDPKKTIDFVIASFLPIIEAEYLPYELLELFCKHIRHFDIDGLEEARLSAPESCYPLYQYTQVDDSVTPTYRNIGGHQVVDVYKTPLITKTMFDWNPIETYKLVDEVNHNGYKIFIDNLNPDTTARDIMSSFHRCGDVLAVEIFRESMRSDILNLEDRMVNPEALISGLEVSRRLRLRELLDKKNMPYRRFYKQNSNVRETVLRSIGGKSPVYAFVYFRTEEAQKKALVTALQVFGVLIAGNTSQTEPASNKTALYLANMPKNITYDLLHSYLLRRLNPYVSKADILSIHGLKNLDSFMRQDYNVKMPKSFIMIEFASHEIATLAWRLLINQKFGNHDIRVGWGTRRTKEYQFDFLTQNIQVDSQGQYFGVNNNNRIEKAERTQPAWWEKYHEDLGDLEDEEPNVPSFSEFLAAQHAVHETSVVEKEPADDPFATYDDDYWNT